MRVPKTFNSLLEMRQYMKDNPYGPVDADSIEGIVFSLVTNLVDTSAPILQYQILGYRAIVVPIKEPEKKLESGIILPEARETAAKPVNLGLVVSVGEGLLLPTGALVPCNVKPGDLVIFDKYSISTITVGHENYFIVDCHSFTGKKGIFHEELA